MLLICYPRCSTCKKAEKWLKDAWIEYEYRDIRENAPSYEELKDWLKKSGLPVRRFFNTSGQLYRSLGLKDKLDGMTEDEQLRLLSTDGMLVKRSIAVKDGKVLVGFKESDWEKLREIL
ncbi:MAG: arsenate reductase family protein [Ruminococcus sp.]|nr:arsenate reductase family protein [Ruminococcus sp.]